MLKTSTPKIASKKTQSTPLPKQSTLDFLRNFARAYTAPLAASRQPMPGIVLN